MRAMKESLHLQILDIESICTGAKSSRLCVKAVNREQKLQCAKLQTVYVYMRQQSCISE